MATEKKADYMVDNGTDFDQIMFKTVTEQVRYSKDSSGKEVSLKEHLDGRRIIESITMKGIGQSYLFVGDKTGYVLTNIYNYGREYNDVRITDFGYNGSEKVYYVFLDKTQATTATMALRLVWEKV